MYHRHSCTNFTNIFKSHNHGDLHSPFWTARLEGGWLQIYDMNALYQRLEKTMELLTKELIGKIEEDIALVFLVRRLQHCHTEDTVS